ncbi:MAG: TonB-dependent receptor [Ignavibacteriales bacterium]|nr:TonB-dependent receptor [Ignavibacteriales bacterium]
MRLFHSILASRFLTLLIITLCPIFPLLAQQSDIRGVVSDSSSGERIPYVNIVIASINKGGAANASGFYLIPSVPAGTYQVTASAVGFVRQIRTVTVRGTEPVTLNFRLPSQAVELEEIVVSGKSKPELLDVQTSVHVVDKAEMKLVPVTTQGDVLKSIQILPGFVSTSDVNSQFNVRGGGSDQNLILLDGMRIYNPFHAFGLFSSFDPDIIRSTEVYTGAFPPEFGGRLSSVINMSSRDGNSSVMSGQANLNFLSSKVQVEGPISESLQAIFTGRKSVFSDTFKEFLKEQVPLSFYDAFLKVTLNNPASEDKYSLQVMASEDDLRSADAFEPDYLWSSRAIGLELNMLSSDRLFWNVFVSAGEFISERDPKSSETAQPSSNTIKDLGLRGNVTYYTDSKDLYFFGFEMSFPNVEYNLVNRLGQQTRIALTLADVSVWFRYQTHWDGLTTDVGLRGDVGSLVKGSSFAAALQPRINASLNLFGNWKAKVSYGTTTQGMVTVTNEDDVIPIFIPWIVIPSSLDPEQATHYVVGIDGNPLEKLSTSLQAYYKNYSSLVTYNRDKIDSRDPDYINSTGESYGGEALVRLSHSFLDVYAAYTLTWVNVNINGFEYSPRYDRRHTVNFLTSFHIAKDFDISVRLEFGSGLPFTQSVGFYDKLTLRNGYPDPFVTETGQPRTLYGEKNAARLPSYHRLDLNASYRVSLFSSVKTAVGINLINLYNRKNIFYFDRTTGQRYNMLGFFPSANVTMEF